ncbi:hypothetical protein Tco_1312310 [Tanacetum coccineum]
MSAKGLKQPGNDIDVYLAPLIDDLKTLWDKGVKVYDAYKKDNFSLRAMIFCTISDFPAYGNLSGYGTKVIDTEVLDSRQSDIILTLCELEMYFPPSFFDVMVHLVSHIIVEIKACGPVFLRYMYPFERYMGILKGNIGFTFSSLCELAGVGTIGLRMIDPARDALKFCLVWESFLRVVLFSPSPSWIGLEDLICNYGIVFVYYFG